MSLEEILAMKPGAELNALVAEQVMGKRVVKDQFFGYMEQSIHPEDGSSIWGDPLPYSEDMDWAEMVVDKMIEKGFDDAICWADFGNGAYTEPEAICKAALCALREQGRAAADSILQEALGDKDLG
ncbi:MAG: hypothetical protein HYX92_04605 [Chloroflexi bacterium]|nr:hypothetical protein [Chloroflexota bacterium]